MNFLELKSVEEANAVDLDEYVFISYSESRNVYIFKIRDKFRKERIL